MYINYDWDLVVFLNLRKRAMWYEYLVEELAFLHTLAIILQILFPFIIGHARVKGRLN